MSNFISYCKSHFCGEADVTAEQWDIMNRAKSIMTFTYTAFINLTVKTGFRLDYIYSDSARTAQ